MESTFDLIEGWLKAERGKTTDATRPTYLRAKHGRNMLSWGWEADTPKWLEFRLKEKEGGTQVEVLAYPQGSLAYSGAFSAISPTLFDRDLALAGYGAALDGLWSMAGFAAEVPKVSARGLSWDQEIDSATTQVWTGALGTLVLSVIDLAIVALFFQGGPGGFVHGLGPHFLGAMLLPTVGAAFYLQAGRVKRRQARESLARLRGAGGPDGATQRAPVARLYLL